MNLQPVSTPTTGNDARSDEVRTRVQGRWLVLARLGWVVLVVLTLAIYFASLPVYVAQLQTICIGTDGSVCTYLQLTPEQGEALKGFGLSPGDYAASMVAFMLTSVVVCLVVSTVIIWRRSHDRIALLVALMLVTFGPISGATITVPTSLSPWQVPSACLYFLANALFGLVFLLFPTGQFVPRWTRWTIVVFLAGQVPSIFFPHASFTLKIHADALGYLMLLGAAVIVVAVQLYRYRRVSNSLQRQQTKWVVFGLAVPITVFVGGNLPGLLFPVLASPGSLYAVLYNVVSIWLTLFIPLSFGFAMLRSRLWEIDVLINRTLVYGTLTAILTGVYVGLVIGLQALLRGIISQDSGVAIVLSTLAIYFLFQPLRRRIQRIIDRRFYRSKYNAATTVAAFSATLRKASGTGPVARAAAGRSPGDHAANFCLTVVASTCTRRKTAGSLESHSSSSLNVMKQVVSKRTHLIWGRTPFLVLRTITCTWRNITANGSSCMCSGKPTRTNKDVSGSKSLTHKRHTAALIGGLHCNEVFKIGL